MQDEELVILHSDRRYAIERIEELNKEIQALGPEFYDVFNQSSETWHDNAPFDALRDRQSLLDAERHNLKKVLQNSTIMPKRRNKSVVDIGSYVMLADSNGKQTKYFIAGDWTPFAGSKRSGATVISRLAPIAEKMVGQKADYSFEFRGKTYVITSIEHSDN